MNDGECIAYFSMEIALEPQVPTYSGGLGILAGDTVRSMADLRVPLVAVTLLWRKGYFYQKLDASGVQTEEPAEWVVQDFLQEMSARATVRLEGRDVQLRAWRYEVTGVGGAKVPVYFLDTDLPENSTFDRSLTDCLYGGDARYRLCQEAVLGIGGIRMLRTLGHCRVIRFHMNEGHASLLALELLEEECRERGVHTVSRQDIDGVRKRCVFTTHTPVPAGHDKFPVELVTQVLGAHETLAQGGLLFDDGKTLNMTYLALNLSHYVNGVAKSHQHVSQRMFARYEIDAITNGVHATSWTAPSFQQLFDQHFPGWREDNFSLRYALNIPRQEVWNSHLGAKRELIHVVNRETNVGMDTNVFTLGFARRATPYKRADLLFTDVARLRAIAARVGRFQVIYAGKSHPRDQGGKELIRKIFRVKEELKHDIKIAYLPNYDMELGRLMTAGVDLWLNTPQPPLEASGTSGMKAALNGVPSLSILDGWWLEGWIEGFTGWSIGDAVRDDGGAADRPDDAMALYDKLEQVILPMFINDRASFIDVMRHAIALNGSFFNTQRMAQQYVVKAYFG
jgi:starch phosphorylase